MKNWIFIDKLWLLALGCFVLPLAAQEQGLNLEIKSKNQPIQTLSIPQSAGAPTSVFVTGATNSPGVNIQATAPEGRYLIRLKDEAVQPVVRKLKISAAQTSTNTALLKQQLIATAASQKQRLVSAQSRLITDGMNRRLISKVHHKFTSLTNSLSVTLSPNSLEEVRKMPQVAGVYPDNKVFAFLTQSVPATHAPKVWDMKDAQGTSVTGKGIKIAILVRELITPSQTLAAVLVWGARLSPGKILCKASRAMILWIETVMALIVRA